MAGVEKAKKAAEERLEAAKALPAAYLRELFPFEGDELPNGWAWNGLGDMCGIRTGKLDSNQAEPNGQYPFFTCSRETFVRVWGGGALIS